MTTFLCALILGTLTSYWRWHDGRDADLRWEHSSLYAAGISILAGLIAYGPWVLDWYRIGAVSVATIFVWRMLLMGFDGWEKWSYMLKSRAAPTAILGILLVITLGSPAPLALALSGLAVAVTYVELTRYEQAKKDKGLGNLPLFTAQQWGEISHGFFVFGLALIGMVK